jgi:hypothetical protein
MQLLPPLCTLTYATLLSTSVQLMRKASSIKTRSYSSPHANCVAHNRPPFENTPPAQNCPLTSFSKASRTTRSPSKSKLFYFAKLHLSRSSLPSQIPNGLSIACPPPPLSCLSNTGGYYHVLPADSFLYRALLGVCGVYW